MHLVKYFIVYFFIAMEQIFLSDRIKIKDSSSYSNIIFEIKKQ